MDQGIIETISQDQLDQALKNIDHKQKKQARSLLIGLYYTGARPNEVLQLRGKDIIKEKQYLIVKLVGSKKGLPRNVYLKYSNPHIKELYAYAKGLFAEMYIFHNFRSDYVRIIKKRNGDVLHRKELSSSLRYHVNKWFTGVLEDSIPPYFLRHNRFSKLSEAGVDMQTLRMLKGSRTMDSVMSYLHLSSAEAKKAARKIN